MVEYVANNLFPREYLNSYWRLVLWYISTDIYRGRVTYVANILFPCEYLNSYWRRRGEVFSTVSIYTFNSVNLAVAVGPSSLLGILQEAGYRDDGPKKFRVMSKYVCMTSYPYFSHAL